MLLHKQQFAQCAAAHAISLDCHRILQPTEQSLTGCAACGNSKITPGKNCQQWKICSMTSPPVKNISISINIVLLHIPIIFTDSVTRPVCSKSCELVDV